MTDVKSPERIWAVFLPHEAGGLPRVHASCSKTKGTEYIRKDLHDALAKERDEYESEGIELNRRLNNALNNLQEWQHRADKAEAEVERMRAMMDENARLNDAMLVLGAYLMEKGEAFRTGEGSELLDAYSAALQHKEGA